MMKIGVQMFSLRNYVPEHGLENALAAISDCGYDCVEPITDYYGFSCEQAAKLMHKYGLGTPSMHIPAEIIANYDILKQIKEAFGIEYAVIPWISKETFYNREAMNKLICDCADCADKLNLTLCYHNHNFEFEQSGYLQSLPAAHKTLKLQPDVYWLKSVNITPLDFLTENAQNIALVHLKEYGENGSNPVVGEGETSAESIIKFAAAQGHKCIITEFEAPDCDEITYMRRSIKFIKETIK